MIFSGIWSGVCRCRRPAIVLGLASWMPLCEACEFRHRAEPAPPPPAVVYERPPQFHYDAEMAVQPTILQPTAVTSGAIQVAPLWTAAVNPTAPTPEDYLVWSGGGQCWTYRPQPEPVFLSGGLVHSLTPPPVWPAFRSGQPYC